MTALPAEALATPAVRLRSPVSKTHFELLDGLRGTAAYCVFLVHSFNRAWAPNGFLGVDFFFMLSGFVIAYSYGGRLSSGRLTLWDFSLRRFVRLYPMVLAGTILGLIVLILHNRLNPHEAYAPRDMALWTGFSLVMVPYFAPNSFNNAVYPLNTVLWSLFFELVANFVYAIFARYMTKPVLAALAVIGLTLTILSGEIDGGKISTFWTGFPRVAFGFFAGALIYETWAEGKLPKLSLGFLPSSLILLAITFFPYQISGLAFLPVAMIFAIILALGANTSVDKRMLKICTFLGLISYPMYLLHRPILYVVVGIGKKFIPAEGASYIILVAIAMIASTVGSYLVMRYYETPMRKWLGRALLGRRGPA